VRRRLYTVAFVMLLSAGCALAITAAQAYWGPAIRALDAFQKNEALLACFDLAEPGERSPLEISELLERHIAVAGTDEMMLYEAKDAGGETLGVAFDVKGKGRNGDVWGILALGRDRKTIRDVRFYRHKETPGYGGKIGERPFAGKFIGKPLVGLDGTPGFRVGLRASTPRTIDAITGASQTTRNVVAVLNLRIRQFLAGGRTVEEIEIPLPPNVSSDQGLAIRVADMVRPTGKPRPPLQVPPGTCNVALSKALTASDDLPIIGELEQITDGVKDAGDGNFVELMDGLQWVQIDLEEPHEIYAVVVWHEHSEPRVYFDVIVQIADDEQFEANVRTLFNNDRDNSAGVGAGSDLHYVDTYEGKLITAGGEVARYVRLYSNDNHVAAENRYTEVEVYGRPVAGKKE
jgi:Na+-transporting NADH:ubiquinone oxidoreductase subunit NqrC